MLAHYRHTKNGGSLEIDRYTAAKRWLGIYAALKATAPEAYGLLWKAVGAFHGAHGGQYGDTLLHIFVGDQLRNPDDWSRCPRHMLPLVHRITWIADQYNFPLLSPGFSQATTAQLWFIDNYVWTDDKQWLPYGREIGVLEPNVEAEGIRLETERWLYQSMHIAEINREVAEGPRRPELPLFIPGTSREAYLQLVSEMAERYMGEVNRQALDGRYGFRAPAQKRRVPVHYRWLVQYQVLGKAHAEIAYEHLEATGTHLSDDAISKALHRTAKLIGLTLRDSARGGRPPGKKLPT